MFAELNRTEIYSSIGNLRQVRSPLQAICKMVGLVRLIGKDLSSSDIGVTL